MQKKLLVILTTIMLTCALCSVLSACSTSNNSDDSRILAVYNTYVANAQDDGETPLSYDEWLKTIKGEKGDKGDAGKDGANGKDGVDGKNGKDGKDGANGVDGKTPTIEISDDGYWIINSVKTEYKAIGKDGIDGTNGTNGTNGVDGKTPTIEISEDGFWVINGTKTEYKAIGKDGIDGKKGEKGDKGDKGETGAKIVDYILQGQDEFGGNVYLLTFDDGTTVTFTAPKGETGEIGKPMYNTKNLWNEDFTVDGFLGQSTPNSLFKTTDYFIPVEVGKPYCASKKTQAVWGYDVNYKIVSTSLTLNTSGVILPPNVCYIKVSFRVNTFPEIGLYQSEKFTMIFPEDYKAEYEITEDGVEQTIRRQALEHMPLRVEREKGVYGGVEDLNKYTKAFNTATTVEYSIDNVDTTSVWARYGVKQICTIKNSITNGFFICNDSKTRYLVPSDLGFTVGDTIYLGFMARTSGNAKGLEIVDGASTFTNYASALIDGNVRTYEYVYKVTEENVDKIFTLIIANCTVGFEITNVYVSDVSNAKNNFIFIDPIRKLAVDKIESRMFENSTWLAFGDSITHAGKYIDAVRSRLPFKQIINLGVGGSCVCSNSGANAGSVLVDSKQAEIESADVITIAYGTNDIQYVLAGTLTIGKLETNKSIESYDKTSIYGALQYMVEKIYTFNPTVKLCLIVPPSWTKGDYELCNQVCSAIVDVANFYGARYVDLFHNSGVNKFNAHVYLPDGLHPSALLGEICGKLIVPVFKEFYIEE